MNATDIEVFRRDCAEAIRNAARAAFVSIGRESLHGFALCTDDDVRTLYHIYAARDWVKAREDEYPEIGLISVEWMQSSDETEFDRLSDRLAAWMDAETPSTDADLDRYRMIRFRALFQALKECRDEGLFAEQTLLCVGSTDPGALMVDLSLAAAPLLNTSANAEAYQRMLTG